MAVHYSTGYPSADTGRFLFLSSLCIAYVHQGFPTYFGLHCNEMPNVEERGDGSANRGRQRQMGGRKGGGFGAFGLHPAVVRMNCFCRKSLSFLSFKKNMSRLWLLNVELESFDDKDWTFAHSFPQ